MKNRTNRIKELGLYYKEAGYSICLVGKQDEMMEICILALNDANVEYQIGTPLDNEKNTVVFYWEPELVEACSGCRCVSVVNGE